MRGENRTADRVIGAIAERAYGVVTRAEMLRAGVSRADIDRRAGRGALIRLHRGVYRVGHRAPSMEATYIGAVKACGAGALLCGRSAAFLFGLIKSGPPPAAQVATPTERRVPGIRTRRDRRGGRRYGTTYRGIPVTSVPRTLVELAAECTIEELARAFHEAGVLHRTTPKEVKAVLARRPSSRGAANVRAIMLGDTRVTLSEVERVFLNQLRDAGLPLPQTNRVASGRRVDCRWPDHGLTVELNSYRFHNSRYSWERDYQREREARARGDEFRRYTWADVVENPGHMLTELRKLLS